MGFAEGRVNARGWPTRSPRDTVGAMVRRVLGLLALSVLGCSSSTTNESPSGTGGSGGSSTGGSSAGGSGGSPAGGGGTGGGVLECPWGDCLKAVNNSPCKPLAVQCLKPADCQDIAAYATCSCGELPGCNYPGDPSSGALLTCIAESPVLAPLCLGLPKCIPLGKSCATSQVTCCAGLVCMAGTCKPG